MASVKPWWLLTSAEQFARMRAAEEALENATQPRPRDEWDESDGAVLWWTLPVVEPPYVGTPLDDDFPDYVTHWTVLIEPKEDA